MHVTPIASSLSRTSGFEKRAITDTSLSGASSRSAGALTGPCPPTNSTFWPCIAAQPACRGTNSAARRPGPGRTRRWWRGRLRRRRRMSRRSTRRPRSEAEVEDRLVEGRHVDRLLRREQPLVGKTGEEAVDGPLEVGDVALEPLVQAHVLEALRVQALLLPRQVREVLRGDRWPPGIVALPHLGRRGR